MSYDMFRLDENVCACLNVRQDTAAHGMSIRYEVY